MIRITGHKEDLSEVVTDDELALALMAAAGKARRPKILTEVIKEIRDNVDGYARSKFYEATGVAINVS